MELNDARVAHARIHNQDVYLPSRAAWDLLLAGEPFGGLELTASAKDGSAQWLARYGAYSVARRGLTLFPSFGWWVLSFLHHSGQWWRVHFEDVICEHCGLRCGPSATPDTVAYAGTGLSNADVWATFDQLPMLPCPHCRALLRRRQTVWLATTDVRTTG